MTMQAPVCSWWVSVSCPVCCIRRHLGWQQTWSPSQQISIHLHQTDRQIEDTTLQPKQPSHWLWPGRAILNGCYSKHRLPQKWSRLVVLDESEQSISLFLICTSPLSGVITDTPPFPLSLSNITFIIVLLYITPLHHCFFTHCISD